VAMLYSKIQFKKVSLLFYILSLLLLFYLYYNFRFTWFGFSLIVRVYLYVFSFYMIYVYNSSGSQLAESLLPLYTHKYGSKGRILLAFERRVLPFLFIFAITVVYTLIDYVREENWPWNPLLLLLGGRYSNLISYSLILYFILNTRKRPLIAIPIFIAISLLYFFGDSMIYDYFPMGVFVSIYRTLKFSAVFFVLLFENPFTLKNTVHTALKAFVLGILFYALLVGIYAAAFKLSNNHYYVQKRTGLNLAKMGYSYPLTTIQKKMVEKKDVSALADVFRYSNFYRTIPEYSTDVWLSMLFSQKSQRADEVAQYMVIFNAKAPSNLLAGFVEERLETGDKSIIDAENFIMLTARSIQGNESDFIEKTHSPTKEFTIWKIRVLRKNGSFSGIPFLIRRLTDINDAIAQEAYISLREITGNDPALTLKSSINSPEVIEAFKRLYLEIGTFP
jgi:hypothetical protein